MGTETRGFASAAAKDPAKHRALSSAAGQAAQRRGSSTLWTDGSAAASAAGRKGGEAPRAPHLVWRGPDADGDWSVALRGVEGWHLAAHGATRKIALGRLGEALQLAASDEAAT
jgi:hypothetical protein